MKNKLGIDTIIILIAIIVVALLLIVVLANKGEEIPDVDVGTTSQSSVPNALKQANDAELLKFNSKLEIARGNQNGQNVKALISRIEEINASGERTVKLVGGENIEDSESYNVSMDYGNDGYINSVKIEKK